MGIYIQKKIGGDMKVIVISGSPRKNAITQVMMKYVYDYAKSKNQDTKLINLSDQVLVTNLQSQDLVFLQIH